MAGKPDEVKAPGLLLGDKLLDSAARRDDVVPFLLGFDVIECRDVELIKT